MAPAPHKKGTVMESGLIVSRAEAQAVKELLVMEVLAGCMSVGTHDRAVTQLNGRTVPV